MDKKTLSGVRVLVSQSELESVIFLITWQDTDFKKFHYIFIFAYTKRIGVIKSFVTMRQ